MSNRIKDLSIIALIFTFFFAYSAQGADLSKTDFEQYFVFNDEKLQFFFPDYIGEQKKALQQNKKLYVYTVKNYKLNIIEALKWSKYAKDNGALFSLVDFDEYLGYFDEGINLLVPYFQKGQWILYNKTQYDRLNPPQQYQIPQGGTRC